MTLAKYYRKSKDKSSGQDIHRPMKSELKKEVKKLRELVRRESRVLDEIAIIDGYIALLATVEGMKEICEGSGF